MNALVRKFRDIRYAAFYGLFLREGHKLETLGSPALGCAWTFCPVGLNKSSVVYSAGVGKDITFEHALADKYGCNIVLLDPSPTGLRTMALPGNQIPQFKFLPLALAGKHGEVTLSPPADTEEGSWSSNPMNRTGLHAPAISLQSLMQENGHNAIDLLKIDIDGSEYEVINHILQTGLFVRQLCVEFHHSNPLVPGVRRSQSIRAIVQLAFHGYKLINVHGNNHTFLKA
jgi:FkbM family methyltransferase